MAKRNKIVLSVAIVTILATISWYYFGLGSFFKKNADINPNGNSLTITAMVTYLNNIGDQVSETARSTITKVNRLKVKTELRGSNIRGAVFTFDFVNPDTSQNEVTIAATSDQNGDSTIDWLAYDSINPEINHDLRIYTPGFLSRKIIDLRLLDLSDTIAMNKLVAGDVNQDRKINWEDYIAWKAKYNQKVDIASTDFNHDGTVNYLDYAVSFGTRCYNATEANQDQQCAN